MVSAEKSATRPRKRLKASEAEAVLREIVIELGGVEAVRASKESRRAFLELCIDGLLPLVDGRAMRRAREAMILTVNPDFFADRDRCLDADRRAKDAAQRRRRYRATRGPRRKARRRSSSRPPCVACGRVQTLLDASGACVNRGRCSRLAAPAMGRGRRSCGKNVGQDR